jgi:hypothetical protein
MPKFREILFTWLLGAAAVFLTILIVNQFFDLNDNKGSTGQPAIRLESPVITGTDSLPTTVTVPEDQLLREQIDALRNKNQELIDKLAKKAGGSDLPKPTNPDASAGAANEVVPPGPSAPAPTLEVRLAGLNKILVSGENGDKIATAVLYTKEYISRDAFDEGEYFYLLKVLKKLYGIKGLAKRQNDELLASIKLLNDSFVQHIRGLMVTEPDRAKFLVFRAEREVKIKIAPGAMDAQNLAALRGLGLLP